MAAKKKRKSANTANTSAGLPSRKVTTAARKRANTATKPPPSFYGRKRTEAGKRTDVSAQSLRTQSKSAKKALAGLTSYKIFDAKKKRKK